MNLAVYGHQFNTAARLRCTFRTYGSGGPGLESAYGKYNRVIVVAIQV